jgi:hypothetical protein
MPGRRIRVTGATAALTVAVTFVALAVGAQWAAADEGWKYDVPYWGGCVVDCTPAPEFGIHCPCYEMPPIIIEG